MITRDDLLKEIELLQRDPKHGSSNRDRDERRKKLKKLGMIRFDRKRWVWEVLPGASRL